MESISKDPDEEELSSKHSLLFLIYFLWSGFHKKLLFYKILFRYFYIVSTSLIFQAIKIDRWIMISTNGEPPCSGLH